MIVPAVVAKRFVPPVHRPHMEKQRCDERKGTENKIKVGTRGAKNSYSKTNQTCRHQEAKMRTND